MKKYLVVILVIIGLSGMALYGEETLDQVLAKNYESRGGLEKIKAAKTMIIEGNAVQMGNETPVLMIVKQPNMMKMEIEIMGKKMVQGYDGKIAWWIMPLMNINEPTEMPEEQAKELKEQAETMDPLVYYKDKGHKLELLGKEDMEGTEVYKLKYTDKDSKKESFYYLDVESGITLKTSTYRKQGESEILIESLTSDYKEVDGMMVPFQIDVKVNGNVMRTFTVTSYKFNTEVDDAIFALPAKK